MKGRRLASQTADMFSALAAPAPAPAPAPVPVPAPVAGAGGLPPTPQARGSQRYQQLWYAAVFPGLIAAEHPASMLHRLSLHAQQFTSFVSIELPNALLLEIKGSLRLFGSLERLHAAIDAVWQQLALPASSATTPSTLAALWCARAGNRVLVENSGLLSSQLQKVPITCTAWAPERLQTLRAMGVTHLGELLRLPRAGLARRLGPGAVFDLDIALARQPAPRRAFVAHERFKECCDFEIEIENVSYLERALEPLIERCAQFLRARQAGVQALELRLRHRAGPVTRVRLGLASITGERRRLSDVLVQKLNRLEQVAPVRAVELISGPLQALSAGSLDAFDGMGCAGRHAAPQLVERLRARLGENAVYGVCTIAEHRPEAAWRRVYELQLGAARVADMTDEGMLRPVWLLGEPEPLHHDTLILEQGPERIESGWWDGKGVARDYYIARRSLDTQARGARLWVFQERHSKRWYLHGVFA